MITFEYPEDREFFANLLAGGDADRLDREFSDYFDFRHPAIKREEFNSLKPKLLKALKERDGMTCQLKLHPDCSKESIWEIDHLVPLASNILNKTLRHLDRIGVKKVVRQSFGSNEPKNLFIACKRCNRFKHNKLDGPWIERILGR